MIFSHLKTGQQSNFNNLLCYSTSCRNNVNYACYSIDCSKKRVSNKEQVRPISSLFNCWNYVSYQWISINCLMFIKFKVRTVEEKNLSPKEVFLQEIKKCQEILKESMTCLQYQAENTMEGFTYKKAKKAFGDLSDLVFFFDYI